APVIADDYKATLPELAVKAEIQAKADEAAAIKVAAVAKQAAADKQAGIVPTAATAVAPADDSLFTGTTVIGLAIGLLVAPFLARKFKGMTAAEVVAYCFELLSQGIVYTVKLLSGLLGLFSKKTNVLPNK
ncbi:MAG: copper oxidase, partial [Methylococcales bacterium]|nr:copper oxidase [Methylococcales bacterium]